MEIALITLLGLAIVGLVCYGLYINGIMTLTAHKAVTFVVREKGLSASFSYCDGFFKRVMIFTNTESRELEFISNLTKGSVSVDIMDKSKKIYVHLDGSSRTASFTPELGVRYYLKVTFSKAGGSYKIVVK